MATLKCGACTCAYNSDEYCCKGDIMVGGKNAVNADDTCCDSFREARGDRYMSALEHPCKTISIDCEATKCVYNSDYKCHADNVKISGDSACDCRETACATFKEK